MGLTDPASCGKEGCSKTWPRDPVLEVECPQCGAEPGELCRRPSGHQPWNPWGRFHMDRDLQALDEGAYGVCPLDRCPQSLDEVDCEIGGNHHEWWAEEHGGADDEEDSTDQQELDEFD